MLRNEVRLTKIISYISALLMLGILIAQFLPFWSYTNELLQNNKQRSDEKFSLAFSKTSNPDSVGVYSVAVPVKSGDTVKATVDVKTPKGACIAGLRFYADEVEVNEFNYLAEETARSTDTKWATLEFEVVAPKNANFVRVWLWSEDGEERSNHYYDNVVVTTSSQPNVANLLADYNYSFEETVEGGNQIADWTLAQEDPAVSIAGYLALPEHHGGLAARMFGYVKDEVQELAPTQRNASELQKLVPNLLITSELLLLLCAAFGLILVLMKPGKAWTTLVPFAAGVIGVWQYLGNGLYQTGANWEIHLVICIAAITVASMNLVNWLLFGTKKK